MQKITQRNEDNFKLFTKEFAKINFENAKSQLNEKDCSSGEIKGLTTNIMEFVSDDNNANLMNHIAAAVENWGKDKTLAWKKKLSEYARANSDIIAVYCGAKDGNNKFVIVAEQSFGDMALHHNDFCFELFDEYENISDFMVLDQEEFKGMKEIYAEFSKIYQRG